MLTLIDVANKRFFIPGGLRLLLYVFETPLDNLKKNYHVPEYKKSFPIDIILLEKYSNTKAHNVSDIWFPFSVHTLIKTIRLKLLTHAYDIKLGLVISKFPLDSSRSQARELAGVSPALETIRTSMRVHAAMISSRERRGDQEDTFSRFFQPGHFSEEGHVSVPGTYRRTGEGGEYSHHHLHDEQELEKIDRDDSFELNVFKSPEESGKCVWHLKIMAPVIAGVRLLLLRNLKPLRYPYAVITAFILLVIANAFLAFHLTNHLLEKDSSSSSFNDFGWAFFLVYPFAGYLSTFVGIVSIFLCRPSFLRVFIWINMISWTFNCLISLFAQIAT